MSTPQRGPGRPEKDNEEISVSAGRKRAAVEHQVHEHLYCEWHGLANCGGGRVPISGCYDGLQKHRHHGPVKTTYENDRTNIHLICPSCHNRWHAKNDPVYDTDEYAEMPHEPRPMTIEEYILVASRSNNEDSTSST